MISFHMGDMYLDSIFHDNYFFNLKTKIRLLELSFTVKHFYFSYNIKNCSHLNSNRRLKVCKKLIKSN